MFVFGKKLLIEPQGIEIQEDETIKNKTNLLIEPQGIEIFATKRGGAARLTFNRTTRN